MSQTPADPAGSSVDAKFSILPDPEKLEAMAEFAAGAGHEINNPLATIIGRAQLLLKGEQDPQRRQMLASISAQAYRIRDMIGDAMLFGRPPLPEIASVDLREIVNRVLSKQSAKLAESQCSASVEIPSGILLRADAVQLAIVFSELLLNSQRALQPAGGSIQIVGRLGNTVAEIEIRDSGKGFTESERRHAFDPFYSGRQAGRGLGFGLSKCWRIIDLHGGQIEILSSPSGPTVVQIRWPLA